VSSNRLPSVSFHRRILLVFLISIALPGLYLSYVGLRSIVQEQELQRGLLVQNVERALEFEIDKIEQHFETTEESIAGKIVVSGVSPSPVLPGTASALQPWIEQAVVFDSHLNLRSPLPFSAEQPARRRPAIQEPALRDKIESAERLEVQGNRSAALSAYQQLLAEAHSLRSQIVLNTYVARCATAIGSRETARRAYEAIIESDSTFLIAQPIPYAAFAWLELIDELVKQGKLNDALQKSVLFHQLLLNKYYRLSLEQYDYFSHKLSSLRNTFGGARSPDANAWATWHALDEQEQSLFSALRQAERIGSWLQNQRRVLSIEHYASTISHHSLSVGERSVPLSLIRIDNPAGPRRWVVLVLRPKETQRRFLLSELQSWNLSDDFNITIRPDSFRSALATELASSAMRKTAPLFPSAVVAVSPGQTSSVTILGLRPPVLSVAFGVLVVGMVLLGILILYRDIRREEELSSMKSEFISNVSHELKTPIAAIRMLADNLRQSRVSDEPRKMEYYQLISKESARLSHLIDNILDFSRVEGKRKTFQLEKHDVSTIVTETVRQFKSLMDEQSHRIEMTLEGSLPEVMADSDALALALFNLLDNAAKYSEKESQIDVRVNRDGGFLCIEVTDHGVGIPKSDREKIFEKFYRVQGADGKKIPGSGIGLTLVREVAEAHHGRVELQSEQGVGSTFRIKLPIGG
jgi:signal transduction histidine kinase